MTSGVLVGVDYGAFGMRAAYALRERPVLLPPDRDDRAPTVLFDSARNISSLGVGFPSVFYQIGSRTPFAYAAQTYTPEALVQSSLQRIRERVTRQAGAAPAATVIAVPTGLSQLRRQALVACAEQAGFDNVSLIDRSIAVALGARSDRDQSGTFVVVSLDYGDGEYSLARLARGRCWIVGSGIEARFSGERLDALIMEDIVLAMRDRQVFLGLRGFTPEQWHSFRILSERIKRRLSRGRSSALTMDPELTDTHGVVKLKVDVDQYALAVKRSLGELIENIGALLDQHQLENTDVDAVLLTGDAATSYPVANVIWEAWPGKVALLDEEVIAIGAVVAAAENAGVNLEPSARSGFTSSADLRGLDVAAVSPSADADRSSQFTEVVSLEEALTRPPMPTLDRPKVQADRLAEIRSLADEGRTEEAIQLLEVLSDEIAALRNELRSRAPISRAQQLIRQGQAMVVNGAFFEAVQLSHQAYAEAPHDARVFAGMMKIHADAGLGMNKPEQYEQAIQILTCAHGHDQTDRTIRQAMAERLFVHASAMHRLHNSERALEAVKRALTYDHKHAGANELATELLRTEQAGSEPAH